VEDLVYLLCAATAFTCSVLLFRGFRRSGTRLLLWCGLFFVSLTLENVTLFIDLVLVPDTDLFILRTSVALVGVTFLLVGLIWDVR
jgi:hypothetical protein